MERRGDILVRFKREERNEWIMNGRKKRGKEGEILEAGAVPWKLYKALPNLHTNHKESIPVVVVVLLMLLSVIIIIDITISHYYCYQYCHYYCCYYYYYQYYFYYYYYYQYNFIYYYYYY